VGLLLASACGGLEPAPRVPLQRTIEVTLVDVFSGSDQSEGRAARNSLQVAVDTVNDRGGLIGNQLEVVAADGQSSPAKATELVRQQLADPSVKLLVGPGTSAEFTAAKAIIEKSGVPNCVTSVSDDALNGTTGTFRSGPTDRARVQALLSALKRVHPEVKKLALLDEGDELGPPTDKLLADESAHQGLTYAGRTVLSEGGDHAAAVQGLLGQGVQGIVMSSQLEDATRTAQAVQQLSGNRPLLLGLKEPSTYEFASQAGDAAVGALVASTNQSYLTGTSPGSWPAGYRSFVNSVSHGYGLAANGVQIQGAPEAADCVLLWAAAVERAGTFRGADVVRALQFLDLPASETALGVHEKLSTTEHSTVTADGVFAYTWVKDGNRYRLQQV
jgi:ABC-type branched-subunit amino acid transport system substrate-binding protein